MFEKHVIILLLSVFFLSSCSLLNKVVDENIVSDEIKIKEDSSNNWVLNDCEPLKNWISSEDIFNFKYKELTTFAPWGRLIAVTCLDKKEKDFLDKYPEFIEIFSLVFIDKKNDDDSGVPDGAIVRLPFFVEYNSETKEIGYPYLLAYSLESWLPQIIELSMIMNPKIIHTFPHLISVEYSGFSGNGFFYHELMNIATGHPGSGLKFFSFIFKKEISIGKNSFSFTDWLYNNERVMYFAERPTRIISGEGNIVEIFRNSTGYNYEKPELVKKVRIPSKYIYEDEMFGWFYIGLQLRKEDNGGMLNDAILLWRYLIFE